MLFIVPVGLQDYDTDMVTGGVSHLGSLRLREAIARPADADPCAPEGAIKTACDRFELAPIPKAVLAHDPRVQAGARPRPAAEAAPMLSVQTLLPPSGPPARHTTPVVVVHGTLADASAVVLNQQPVLNDGHPIDLDTYQTIKDGRPLQESGQILSSHINDDRVELARANVSRLKALGNDITAIEADLGIDADLHGDHDPSARRLAALVPPLVSRIDSVLAQPAEALRDSFSLKMRRMEEALVREVAATGFANHVSDPETRDALRKKVAAEIVDAIVPKAVLVGHSMGGFVSYTVAMNPTDEKTQGSPFAYDGGNGVSTIIAVSSPIKSGTRNPLPPGLANYAYDNLDKDVLTPLEQTPQGQLIALNPWLESLYEADKSIAQSYLATASAMYTLFTAPLTWMQKPGVEQIADGSTFIKKYVAGKHVPAEMTAFSFTNQDDGIAEADRCLLDERQANAFNVDVKVDLPPEILAKRGYTPAVLTHFMMGKIMFAHGDQAKEKIFQNPSLIPKVLDRTNYDGVRWLCLTAVKEMVDKNPTLLQQPAMTAVRVAIESVADEKVPFKDAPSAMARQILNQTQKA